jgi:hypothetical protein
MKTKITATVVGLMIILTGCASSPSGVDPAESSEPAPQETSTPADADFAIQTVKERFEVDCFAGLGDETSYRYEENPGGTMREGFVYASVGGNILQFSVGMNENTGSFITLPTGDLTIELLESVGC